MLADANPYYNIPLHPPRANCLATVVSQGTLVNSLQVKTIEKTGHHDFPYVSHDLRVGVALRLQ